MAGPCCVRRWWRRPSPGRASSGLASVTPWATLGTMPPIPSGWPAKACAAACHFQKKFTYGIYNRRMAARRDSSNDTCRGGT